MQSKNYYQILGVRQTASPADITAAKNKLAKKYHPDATAKEGVDTTDQMALILEAYATLSDPEKRKQYDHILSGRDAVMQTFDLHENTGAPEDDSIPIVNCWRAANALYDLVQESIPYLHQKPGKQKDKRVRKTAGNAEEETLSALTVRALEQICILREEKIPEQYWHPDTMNWLLFSYMKNRNYTPAHLMTLYDEHLKKDLSTSDRRQVKKNTSRYLRDLDRLLAH